MSCIFFSDVLQNVLYFGGECAGITALQQTEMRMVRWMCGINVKDRVPSKKLRERD